MKLLQPLIYFCLLAVSATAIAQLKHPVYEQLAFDFYRTTILDSFPVKKKITVFKYILDAHPDLIFTVPDKICSLKHKSKQKFEVLKTYAESQYFDFASMMIELNTDSINKKQFSIKKQRRNYYPKLLITLPFTEEDNTDRVFVNVHEELSERLTVIYTLEFNTDLRVVDWCRTEQITYIEY